MRSARALAAAVLTFGLVAAGAPAAEAAPAAVSGCHFSEVKLSQSTVTVGTNDWADVDVTATAIGCEAYDHAILNFSASVGGYLSPSEDDATHWSGWVEADSEYLANSEAGTWKGTANLEDDGAPVKLGVSLTVLRKVVLDDVATPSETVKKNKKFYVGSHINRADWDKGSFTAFGKKKVRIQFRPSSSKKWKTIKMATSRALVYEGGEALGKVKVSESGCLRLVSDATTRSARGVSVTVCVKVKK